jgi:hypothetical protein
MNPAATAHEKGPLSLLTAGLPSRLGKEARVSSAGAAQAAHYPCAGQSGILVSVD